MIYKHLYIEYCDLPDVYDQVRPFRHDISESEEGVNEDIILCISGWVTPLTIGITIALLSEWYYCIAIKSYSNSDYFIVVTSDYGYPQIGECVRIEK